ncbi:MAG: DUF3467 domain-containing protein [Paramuribaculum sp.]|nr:DUF3467 domain-containing protein [Paramuribaculum sp.]MDE7471717.1 DUF3467 domain-containing protein [Paramuribaculum sp.]
MENNKPNELKIELTPEVASGIYSNLAVITHSPNEVFMDFIAVAPNMPQAKVQSRIIMTPENAKNLLFALRDNIAKYEATFGEIEHKMPKNQGGNTANDIKNPFIVGGKA